MSITIRSAAIRKESELKALRMKILEHLFHSREERALPCVQTFIHIVRDHLRGGSPRCFVDPWNKGGPHVLDLPTEPAADLVIMQLLRLDDALVSEPRIRLSQCRAIELHAVMKRAVVIEEYRPFAHTLILLITY